LLLTRHVTPRASFRLPHSSANRALNSNLDTKWLRPSPPDGGKRQTGHCRIAGKRAASAFRGSEAASAPSPFVGRRAGPARSRTVGDPGSVYFGGLRSPASQPVVADFIGSCSMETV
jgi:hypothetical protein